MGVKRVPALRVRHMTKGRFVRSYKVRRGGCVIGSSNRADIKIASDSIAGSVCSLEKGANGWVVLDLGSQPDVKVNGKNFVELDLKDKSALQIGDHTLEIDYFPEAKGLFKENKKYKGAQETYTIVRWKGRILHVTSDESELAAFKHADSKHLKIEKVSLPKGSFAGKPKFKVDDEVKKPLVGLVVGALIFILLMVIIPKPEPEKPPENKFTKMIYDAKVLQRRKKQVASGGSFAAKATAGKAVAKKDQIKHQATNKAVISMRKAGVQSIISKIAKRAAKNAQLMQVLASMPNNGQRSKKLGEVAAGPSDSAVKGKAGKLGKKSYKVGKIGTEGKGGGSSNYKLGTGIGTGTIGRGEVGLDDEESVVQGGLDREVIAARIREYLGQIRYCYERQLAANSDLHGKIKVNFVIGADGRVNTQSVLQSTLNSTLVEECILRRIARWSFPKPKGGTKVIVSYPFLLKSVK